MPACAVALYPAALVQNLHGSYTRPARLDGYSGAVDVSLQDCDTSGGDLTRSSSRESGGLNFLGLRRPILTWGATRAEATSRLPGDELLSDADGLSTRAIEIDAPASAVWPWLAQMGPAPRRGAYTYDWIENLFGLNMHSVDQVLPEFQHPEVGETIGLGPAPDAARDL